MRQIWTGNNQDQLSPSATEYNTVMSNTSWHASANTRWPDICPASGTISEAYIELHIAPDTGKSYTFTLMVNDVATSVVVTISDLATSGSDLVNTASIMAGQKVYWRCVPSGTPDSPFMIWSLAFDGTTNNESVLMGVSVVGVSNSATTYAPLVSSAASGPSTTEADHQQLVAGSGTIKSLYVQMETDAGTDPDAFRFTVRKNGSSTSLTATLTADATTANDTANSFTVAPGDLLNIMIEPLNTPSAAPRCTWGVVFLADTDGESLMFGGSSQNVTNGSIQYKAWMGVVSTGWQGVEANSRTLANTMSMKSLYVVIGASPGTDNTWVFTSRTADGIDGNLTVTIAEPDVAGNDTTHIDNIVPGDHLAFESVPISNPNITTIKFGAIQFPTTPTQGSRGGVIPALIAAGYI